MEFGNRYIGNYRTKKYYINVTLPKVDPLIMTELSVCHVTMVTNDFAHVLWGHVFFLSIHKAKFPFLCITFGLQLLPFAS